MWRKSSLTHILGKGKNILIAILHNYDCAAFTLQQNSKSGSFLKMSFHMGLESIFVNFSVVGYTGLSCTLNEFLKSMHDFYHIKVCYLEDIGSFFLM